MLNNISQSPAAPAAAVTSPVPATLVQGWAATEGGRSGRAARSARWRFRSPSRLLTERLVLVHPFGRQSGPWRSPPGEGFRRREESRVSFMEDRQAGGLLLPVRTPQRALARRSALLPLGLLREPSLPHAVPPALPSVTRVCLPCHLHAKAPPFNADSSDLP